MAMLNSWVGHANDRNNFQSVQYGDPDAVFLLHLNADQSVSFEPQMMGGHFVGIKKNGYPKLGKFGKPSTRFYLSVV